MFVASGSASFTPQRYASTSLHVGEKKKKAKQEQGRKNRVRHCWDLQQCLTVRNSVVYINCNLFHSLSGPGESCVCERAHKCLHACTYVHFSLRVSVCTHACYVSVYVRTPS